LREPPPTLAKLNPAFIRFTSGTTGDAKGVVLSHETIFERIQAANQGLFFLIIYQKSTVDTLERNCIHQL
jgi:long-subunit acyl-CoA synthetase (AMP-forming)